MDATGCHFGTIRTSEIIGPPVEYFRNRLRFIPDQAARKPLRVAEI